MAINLKQHARATARVLKNRLRTLLPRASLWRETSDSSFLISHIGPKELMDLHRTLVKIDPHDGVLHYRFAELLEKAGDAAAAESHLEQAVIRDPGAPIHWNAWVQSSLRLRGEDATGARLSALPSPPTERRAPVAHGLALAFLGVKRCDLAFAHGRAAFGERCRGLEEARDLSGVYSVALHFEDGGYTIQFANDFLYWPFLNERLITLAPYLDRLAGEGVSGHARLSVGDAEDGPDRQLCFSSADGANWLIPDSMFLQSQGYRDLRAHIDKTARPWMEREDLAYWRGSLTGYAHRYDDIMRLPRIELSLLSLHRADISAKITDLSQFGPWLPTLHQMLDGLDLLGPRESVIENIKYRYLIDIDGNSNSWPGLFNKMLMGGYVFKLRSAFRQWYYDRLEADEHVCFIDDVSDLPEALERARMDPAGSRRIAARAARFARSITPESEYPALATAVRAALA